jgi:hypothetical protein
VFGNRVESRFFSILLYFFQKQIIFYSTFLNFFKFYLTKSNIEIRARISENSIPKNRIFHTIFICDLTTLIQLILFNYNKLFMYFPGHYTLKLAHSIVQFPFFHKSFIVFIPIIQIYQIKKPNPYIKYNWILKRVTRCLVLLFHMWHNAFVHSNRIFIGNDLGNCQTQ